MVVRSAYGKGKGSVTVGNGRVSVGRGRIILIGVGEGSVNVARAVDKGFGSCVSVGTGAGVSVGCVVGGTGAGVSVGITVLVGSETAVLVGRGVVVIRIGVGDACATGVALRRAATIRGVLVLLGIGVIVSVGRAGTGVDEGETGMEGVAVPTSTGWIVPVAGILDGIPT